jgi:hypothetical protein
VRDGYGMEKRQGWRSRLVHVALDSSFGQILAAPADELVNVHVHELEDERQASCWLETA